MNEEWTPSRRGDGEAGGSSASKLLAILDLFCVESPLWSAEEIIGALGYSRPQGYRYLRELCASGLLARFSGAYTLGSRAIELDYIARESDPLLRAALPVARQLREDVGCDVLVANMVGDRIVTIHHERGSDENTVTFSRGRLLPLLRGAGSKVILAALPARKQKELYERRHDAGEPSALGKTWDEVRASLKDIRRAGYAVSVGELDPQNVGLSVPLVHAAAPQPASLVLVLSRPRYLTTDRDIIVALARTASERIVAAIESNAIQVPRKA